MKGVLKIVGVLVLIFLAIPSLVVVIVSTSSARVVTQPTFLSEVPRRVIREFPEVVDKAFHAAKQPNAVQNPNARAWIAAASKVQTTPNQLLQKMGVYSWLQTELDAMFQKISSVIRGNKAKGDIALNLRPLNKALVSPVFQSYVRELLKHLPACTASQSQDWGRWATRRHSDRPLPGCNPGAAVTHVMLGNYILRASKMPAQITIIKAKDIPSAFLGAKLARVGVWFGFLLPLLLLVLGASLASSHRKGALRWFGFGALAGGSLPLIASWFFKEVALQMTMLNPTHWKLSQHSQFWTTEANRVLFKKISLIANDTISPILTSTSSVASSICLIGVLFVVLSLAAPGKKK